MYLLHDYFRSSAAYRVRIALNYKRLPYQLNEIHLVRNGGEQHTEQYKKLNPQGRVPTLQKEDVTITQSLAILEYLQEMHPEPSILPADPLQRAKARSLAYIIACDVHPLNNLAVLQYLKKTLSVSDQAKQDWYAHWIIEGFTAIEAELKQCAGQYCVGDQISIADICLAPQMYNAHRFEVDLSDFPKICSIYEQCMKQDAFRQADPDAQPGAKA